MFASCGTDPYVKIWAASENSWTCHYEKQQTSPVGVMEWCFVMGKGEAAQIMMARSVLLMPKELK